MTSWYSCSHVLDGFDPLFKGSGKSNFHIHFTWAHCTLLLINKPWTWWHTHLDGSIYRPSSQVPYPIIIRHVYKRFIYFDPQCFTILLFYIIIKFTSSNICSVFENKCVVFFGHVRYVYYHGKVTQGPINVEQDGVSLE